MASGPCTCASSTLSVATASNRYPPSRQGAVIHSHFRCSPMTPPRCAIGRTVQTDDGIRSQTPASYSDPDTVLVRLMHHYYHIIMFVYQKTKHQVVFNLHLVRVFPAATATAKSMRQWRVVNLSSQPRRLLRLSATAHSLSLGAKGWWTPANLRAAPLTCI